MTNSPGNWLDETPPAVRVLIVEDEWPIAEELKERLKGMGFEVPAICASSEQAITLCEQLRPNLVLMDICLSTEMDGIEAARVIGNRLDIPVVYLTAFTNRDLVDRAVQTAPYGYLLKPFNPLEIKVIVKAAVQRHALDRQVRHKSQLLEAILASVADAVIAAEPGGRVIYLNREAEWLTHFSASEALHNRLEGVFQLVGEPGESHAGPTRYSYRTLVTRTLNQAKIELAQYPLKGDSGQTEGEVYTFRYVPDS